MTEQPERRQPMRLHEEDRELLIEIKTILKDPNNGLCATVKKHDEAIYGNGTWGIKTRLLFVYAAVGMLAMVVGADHPIIRKIMMRFGGF